MSHATSDNDDACVSITPQTEAGGSSSNSSRRKRKSGNGKSGEEWQRRLASTSIAQFNRNNAFEIKNEI